MNAEMKKHIHYLKTNSRNWIGACLPKFKMNAKEVLSQTPLSAKELKDLPWHQRHDYLSSLTLEVQERRWYEAAGVNAEDAHFTVIVPIHNEEISLPSFLGTLLLSDIPSSVDMNIVFITNACHDASIEVIDNFFGKHLSDLKKETFSLKFKDPDVNLNYKMGRLGNIAFLHVDTRTPGKANALGIGNSIARASNHLIAVSIDANNYVEPDTIRAMFARAHKAFQSKPGVNDTVLLYGKIQRESTKASHRPIVEDTHEIAGWIMAWNTEWVHSIGGPPAVAVEDYAMKVLAKAHNFKIERVDEARIWGYDDSNLKSMFERRVRYIRGKLQLLKFVEYDPVVLQIVEQEGHYMKNLFGRLQYLFGKIKKRPLNLPKYIASFLCWEYVLIIAKRDYHRNPTNQSWEKIV